jgi:glycerol-3-phosphate dehydrogenase
MKIAEEEATRRVDLLVVGGGIHGLFAAYDAAARGLSVRLVEGADFGSGLSFNHQRTIHGGLRALEHGRLGKVRSQIAERRTWARIAPHLLRPLPFLIGTYRFTKRSRLMLRAGFRIYDLVGRHRNSHVATELHLPKGRLESAAATRRLFQGVNESGLTGGAIYYDYQTKHPDRLTWTVALAAQRAGARLDNYLTMVAPLKRGATIAGARVRDEHGQESDIEAAVTLLAAGSGTGPLMQACGLDGAPPLVRAMNLLLDRAARDIATAAPSPAGRMLTTVPWRGFVLVGTHQSREPVAAPESAPPADAVAAFLDELNATFPRLQAAARDIRLVHHGLTPAVANGGRYDLLPEPRIISGASRGAPGVVALIGVKYTTARLAAEHAVDAVCAALGRSKGRCATAIAALPHASIADVEGRLVETLRSLGLPVERDTLEHLASWYGTEASDVVRYAAESGLTDRLESTPVLAAEIAYAVDHSHARHLSDAVLRRTALGSAGHPGRPALTRAAAVMGGKLGWLADRQVDEVRKVEAVYPAAT